MQSIGNTVQKWPVGWGKVKNMEIQFPAGFRRHFCHQLILSVLSFHLRTECLARSGCSGLTGTGGGVGELGASKRKPECGVRVLDMQSEQ